MAQPLGPVAGRRRSPADLAKGARILSFLGNFLPDQQLGPRVRTFLGNLPVTSVGDAFGGLDQLAELLSEAGQTVDRRALEAECQRLSRGLASEVDDAFAKEEIATARAELVRHWVDLVTRGLGQRSTVALNSHLVPVDGPDGREQWRRYCRARTENLSNAVALSRDDLHALTETFVGGVKEHIRHSGQPFELPDQVLIAPVEGGYAATAGTL